ncbi:sensor domain-containing protein [Shewanella aestuarii]|uniref:cyclic-guanylate-specific phosphodiesterase n=1 Tax=Shewanella aestuarii TaxID=1028752 RepID=A0A6G9QM78_9GAMM|nr:EAL domain-containing protein [Shewanella aestuarii]QIR15498.1 EAL domain-containing protein [Shewanella aestuarii]
MAILSITALLSLSWVFFAKEGVAKINQVQNFWVDYSQQTVKEIEILEEIHHSIGFGGLIHHFKNYVLRHNPSYLDSAKESIQKFKHSLYSYHQFVNSAAEEQAILDIKNVVEQYEANLELVTLGIANGQTIAQIDKVVKVDDEPAFIALAFLKERALARAEETRHFTTQKIKETTQFLLFSILAIPVMFIFSGILIRFIKVNQRIQEAYGILDNLLKSMPDAVLSFNRDGKILRASKQAQRLLGYSHAELSGMQAVQLMLPEQRNQYAAKIKTFVKHSASSRITELKSLFVLSKAGQQIPVEINLSRVDVADVCGIIVIRDISGRLKNELSLIKSQQQLMNAQKVAHLGHWEWLVKEQQFECSKQTQIILGFPGGVNHLTLDSFIDRIHPKDKDLVRNAFNDAINKQQGFALDCMLAEINGEERIVHLIGEVTFDDQNQSLMLSGTVQDITHLRQTEQRVLLAAAVFENTTEGVLITDKTNRIIAVNNAYTNITGYDEDEVLGLSPDFCSSGHHDKDFYREMWHQIKTRGKWRGEIWDRRKDGSVFPKWVSINKVTDENANVVNYVAVFSDITHMKESEQRLEYIAQHDSLTDLPNRMLFNMTLEHAMAVAKRKRCKLALFFMDLDRFKQINDSLGHPVGDALLVAVTKRLMEDRRASDTISRLGGDEFTIIFEGVNGKNSILNAANSLLDSFKTPFIINHNELYVSFSVGVAVYPDDGETITELVKNADTAMYKAKRDGGSQVVFYDESQSIEATERFSIGNNLFQAMKELQFELHYQPQIDLSTNRIVGVEALARWTHPQLGMISPAKFIPAAEENGLIEEIGKWSLITACQQMNLWKAQGLPSIRMSVNISGKQITSGLLVDSVKKVLNDTGINPNHLILEITESSVMQQAELAVDTLKALRALGVGVAIDDFGTDYSSLTYLKRFKIDKLKIDRSFVMGLPEDKEDAAIVKAIIAMSHSLGFSVIAEGVETETQKLFMLENGCEEMQGYLFSPAVPADKFAELWSKHHS